MQDDLIYLLIANGNFGVESLNSMRSNENDNDLRSDDSNRVVINWRQNHFKCFVRLYIEGRWTERNEWICFDKRAFEGHRLEFSGFGPDEL